MSTKKLLVLDTSFSYEAVIARGLMRSVTCRDLDGFFDHVWTVHPFASLVTSHKWGLEFGPPVIFRMSEKHTFIEGKIGQSRFLSKLPKLNFALAQIVIFYKLFFLIRRENIDVIRAGDPLYLGIFAFFLSKITGVPFIVRVGANNEKIRSNTGKCMMPRLFLNMSQERFVERFVLSRASLVAGANLDNLKFAINSSADPTKCTLFRYGNLIDPLHFTNPLDRNYNDNIINDELFILCIARLELVKKIDDVIRVLAEIRKQGTEIKLLLVGEGREQEKLVFLATELNVLDYVIFCGNKDQQWLSSIIPKATIVISPHTGRALTEAALGGAPVVAYDIDWQSELIEQGITGELVPYADWKKLAESAIKLIHDKEYAREMGNNLRVKTLELMDPIRLNNHERNHYNKIISKK